MAEADPPRDPMWPSLALLVFLGWLGLATVQGEIDAWLGGKLFLLATITLWFLGRLGASMREGAWPTLETHWGGLGGGLGGWRASPALIYLVGALWFGGLLAYTAQGDAPAAGDAAAATTPGAATTTSDPYAGD